MRISSRTDYGVRALFELALHYGEGPIQSREIAADRKSRKRIFTRCSVPSAEADW